MIRNPAGHPRKTRELLTRGLPDFAAAAAEGTDGERDCHAMALATPGEAQRMPGRHDEAAANFAAADAILAKLDVDGFRDDVFDLLEWMTRLDLDRHDANATRAMLARQDALPSSKPPASQRRIDTARSLHQRLDDTDMPAPASKI